MITTLSGLWGGQIYHLESDDELVVVSSAISVEEQRLGPRTVERAWAAIGHPTLRLIRVCSGNFFLGDLPLGKWRVLSANECALIDAGG